MSARSMGEVIYCIISTAKSNGGSGRVCPSPHRQMPCWVYALTVTLIVARLPLWTPLAAAMGLVFSERSLGHDQLQITVKLIGG